MTVTAGLHVKKKQDYLKWSTEFWLWWQFTSKTVGEIQKESTKLSNRWHRSLSAKEEKTDADIFNLKGNTFSKNMFSSP